jgi:hypothetical protein
MIQWLSTRFPGCLSLVSRPLPMTTSRYTGFRIIPPPDIGHPGRPSQTHPLRNQAKIPTIYRMMAGNFLALTLSTIDSTLQ